MVLDFYIIIELNHLPIKTDLQNHFNKNKTNIGISKKILRYQGSFYYVFLGKST